MSQPHGPTQPKWQVREVQECVGQQRELQGTHDVVRDHRSRIRIRRSSPPLPSRETGLSTFRG